MIEATLRISDGETATEAKFRDEELGDATIGRVLAELLLMQARSISDPDRVVCELIVAMADDAWLSHSLLRAAQRRLRRLNCSTP